jgi:hypothetical protein
METLGKSLPVPSRNGGKEHLDETGSLPVEISWEMLLKLLGEQLRLETGVISSVDREMYEPLNQFVEGSVRKEG